MPVALMGFSPSEPCPSNRSRSASRRPQPSCRSRLDRLRLRSASALASSMDFTIASGPTFTVPVSSRPPSGPGTSVESAFPRSGLTSRGARCSPGVCASSGFHIHLTWEYRFRFSSSHGLLSPRCCDGRNHLIAVTPVLRSLARSGNGRVGSHPHADPLEVPNLFSLLAGSKSPSALAHDFTGRPEPRHRALRTALRADWNSYRSPSRNQFRLRS
jgi:hypothetical protein